MAKSNNDSRQQPPPAPSSGGPDAPVTFEHHVFAVPESRGERRGVMATRILPEDSEENEETLVRAPRGRSDAAGPSFDADRFEKWFVFLLFALGTAAILVSSIGVGMCWDEGYYLDVSWRTMMWVEACFDPQVAAIKGGASDLYWEVPPGYASIPRLINMIGWGARGQWKDPFSPVHLTFMRWPVAVCFGLTLVMLYLLVRRTHGRVSAWLAVTAYFFMPHIFGHAHFAVTETPTVLMIVLVVYAFLRGLESGPWAAATGILFGLALATKINAVFLPLILFPWAFLFRRREALGNFYAMFLLSPFIMVMVWPWLWHQPVQRFIEYLNWSFLHEAYPVLYFNKVCAPPAWHYPVVLTILTVLPTILVLILLGIARTLQAPRRQFLGLLYLWAALVPILANMGSAAKYDGVRLFMPAFVFLAAVAGIGGGVLVRIAAFFDRGGQRFSRGRTVLVLLLLAIAINGGWALLSVRPYYLTYFNSLIGGRKGAYARGMEIAYWCEGLNREGLDKINEVVPDGASLAPMLFNIKVLEYYQHFGLLKPGIRVVLQGPADYRLLQYRRGLFGPREQGLAEKYKPLLVFGPPDAPLVGLYKTGPEFEPTAPEKPKDSAGISYDEK